jgi:hypothetical protein
MASKCCNDYIIAKQLKDAAGKCLARHNGIDVEIGEIYESGLFK